MSKKRRKSKGKAPVEPPKQRWGIELALFALAAIVFAPVTGFGFVGLDDPGYVSSNPHVQAGLTTGGMSWALTTTQQGNWHPLTWWSLMLDAELGDGGAGLFHTTNALLHALAAALLFRLLWRMTGATWRPALVAALFAVHPLHVESVAWISERKDVLSTVLMFITMLAWLRHRDRPSTGRYATVMALFALGLMAKPMLVTLPAVLLLLDVWPLRRRPEASWKSLALEKLPLFALSAVSSVVTVYAQKAGSAVAGLDALPFGTRLANAVVSYAGYLWKTARPVDLAVPYPHPYYPLTPLVIGGSALLLIAITVLVVRARKSHPWGLVGWLWYVGTLVPVIGLVQVGSQAMADRYTYVPSIGLFVIVAWGGALLLDRFAKGSSYVKVGLVAVLLLALGLTARAQTMIWRDTATLFGHTVTVTKNNPLALVGYGNSLMYQHRYGEALRYFEQAATLEPRYYEAHLNRGFALLQSGRHDEAATSYGRALELEPERVTARLGLATSLLGARRTEEALPHLQRVVEQDPDNFGATVDLANALATLGQPAEAMTFFEKALTLRPDDGDVLVSLGTLYMMASDWMSARERFERAMGTSPDNVSLHHNLGIVYEQMGYPDMAQVRFERALQLQPDHAAARRGLERVTTPTP